MFRIFENIIPQRYTSHFNCYSVAMMAGHEREDVEEGGLIILPPSALDTLTRLNIEYPMLFKLTNRRLGRHTHCGVLEFVSDDDSKAYIPHWMMQNLCLKQGERVHIESLSLEKATFARFQPQSVDFLDISSPKAVLEKLFRSFACLTKGDTVALNYNGKIYELLVLETSPEDAVRIIDCDMQVDFAPPVGYVQPKRVTATPKEEEEEPSLDDIPEEYLDRGKEQLFPGTGSRLDGKKKKCRDSTDGLSKIKPTITKKGIPDLNYKIGKIVFKRKVLQPANQKTEEMSVPDFEAFSGSGQSLRHKCHKNR